MLLGISPLQWMKGSLILWQFYEKPYAQGGQEQHSLSAGLPGTPDL